MMRGTSDAIGQLDLAQDEADISEASMTSIPNMRRVRVKMLARQ
jgi:hypothetical protein